MLLKQYHEHVKLLKSTQMENASAGTKNYIPENQRMNEHTKCYSANQGKQYLNMEVLNSHSLHPHLGGNGSSRVMAVVVVPSSSFSPSLALSLPTPLTLFLWHIINLVMQP